MPSRLVKTIVRQAEEDRERIEKRDYTDLERRFATLLDRLDPGKHPEMLNAVEGIDFLTEWERLFSQMGAMILLDHIGPDQILLDLVRLIMIPVSN